MVPTEGHRTIENTSFQEIVRNLRVVKFAFCSSMFKPCFATTLNNFCVIPLGPFLSEPKILYQSLFLG